MLVPLIEIASGLVIGPLPVFTYRTVILATTLAMAVIIPDIEATMDIGMTCTAGDMAVGARIMAIPEIGSIEEVIADSIL